MMKNEGKPTEHVDTYNPPVGFYLGLSKII